MSAAAPKKAIEHRVTVLLIDDQAIVGEAVRRMLADEKDIAFHFCSDPSRAIEQANEIGPTVILQDLVMPEVDGLTLVKFFRVNPRTKEVPMIVLSSKEEPLIKAQAFGVGANDYIVKLPDKLELIARIRYHSKGYIAQLERNEAYRELAEREQMMADEIAQATRYVFSLLPEPLTTGPIRVEWKYIPSTTLGGDSFGYHWLDDEHFAAYILDVSGHGVGASLLSVSAMNVLRSQALPGTDFRDPGQVLNGLNTAFPMEKQNGKYFTMWYGVYRKSKRQLQYASAGHPKQLLVTGPDAASATMKQMRSNGPVVGMLEGMTWDAVTLDVGAYAHLYLFSDGVYEVEAEGGNMWTFNDFVAWMGKLAPEDAPIEKLFTHVRERHTGENLADDFSMLHLTFE